MQDMTRKLRYLFVLLFVSVAGVAYGQTGAISGTVYDENKEPIIGAIVEVRQGGVIRGGSPTDVDGNYMIKPLNPAQDYQLSVKYAGYKEIQLNGVIVSPDRTTYQNFNMEINAQQLVEVVVRDYKVPLIKKDEPGTTTTITSEQIEKLPTRQTSDAASMAGGTYQSRSGGAINIAGARSSGTLYIVDGVQVNGVSATNMPPNSIDQISVVTSGIPAKYGDATGGVISITTKGGAAFHTGSVGFERSVDGYGHNLLFFNINGPLLKKRVDSTLKKTVLGYSLSGQYLHDEDSEPNYFNNYVVKGDKLREIQENPLVAATTPTGSTIFRSRAETVTMQDLEISKKRPNADYKNIRMVGKLDYQINEDMNIVAGGNFSHIRQAAYSRFYSLFAPQNMPYSTNQTGRGFIRFSQRFGRNNNMQAAEGEENAKTPLISNAYYSVQADYQTDHILQEDPNHKQDPFKYGYVGKFDEIYEPLYATSRDSVTGIVAPRLLSYDLPVAVNYTRSELNPLLANYNTQLYNYLGESKPATLTEIFLLNGLRNGDQPPYVFGSNVAVNTGHNYPGYFIQQKDQFAFNVDASFDLQPKRTRHQIEFGLYYQQRTERSYDITAAHPSNSLWSRMRLLANRHLRTLDYTNPYWMLNGQRYSHDELTAMGITPGPFDTIYYDRFYDSATQSNFDRNLRASLGLSPDSKDIINIDAMDPSQFSLDMFSADELINSGNQLANWYGYDHTGKKIDGQVNFNDWFTQKDANGNYTRRVGAFRPNYIAGYIMDKFELPNNTLFHLGVRVERFDANTKVLKDPYSLYATHTVASSNAFNENTPDGKAPANIGSDYVVYVGENSGSGSPTVVGYRNGDDWFDSRGEFVTDPAIIRDREGVDPVPHLQRTSNDGRALTMRDEGYDPNTSFTDYTPQVNVMPRVSFTFPIADQSMFYAHYDVLVQRPKAVNEIYATPLDYYYINQNSGAILPNPDLKPEKMFDYELGFQQVLSQNSAITITGFYKERKDMIQLRDYRFAFPNTYTTYGNRDFSTTKGLILKYDLRRINHLALTLSYTLQFAEGTGSNSVSSNALMANLIGAQLPNLRFAFPLSYDSRHNLVANIDYRYDRGEGPVIGGAHILENVGLNLVARARSGEPYTSVQQAASNVVSGAPMGSRLPWHYMMDLRIDKTFDLGFMNRRFNEGTNRTSRWGVTAFVYITNLLNTRDITGVYGFTGRPDDDGWLASPQGQLDASIRANPQSYIDLYTIARQNQGFLNLPRRINLGMTLNF